MQVRRSEIWRRGYRLLGTMALAAISGAVRAAQAETLADYGCEEPIHLAFYEFGPFYHDGIGIDRDVVDELAARTGCRIETTTEPRAQIWQELEANTLDMSTGGIRTDARARFAYFIPYFGLKNAVVAGRDIAPQIHSFDDILENPNWRIGVVEGYLHGPYFDYRLSVAGARVIRYPDQNAIYRALQDGEVQVIVSPAFNYEYFFPSEVQRRDFALIDVSPAPPISEDMLFNKRRFTPAQIGAWSRLFEQMRLDGTLERIFRRQVSPEMARILMTY